MTRLRGVALAPAGAHEDHVDIGGEHGLESEARRPLSQIQRLGPGQRRPERTNLLAAHQNRVHQPNGVNEHEPSGDKDGPSFGELVERAQEEPRHGQTDGRGQPPRHPVLAGEEQRSRHRPADCERPRQLDGADEQGARCP